MNGMKKFILSILLVTFLVVSCGSPTDSTTKGGDSPSNLITYSDKQVYLKGDFVSHGGKIYQATTRIVGKDPAKYSITATSPLNPWKVATLSDVNKALTTVPDTSGETIIASVPTWDSGKTYIAGDIIKGSDGKYYKSMWWNQNNDPKDVKNQNGVSGNWGPWKPMTEAEAKKELGYTSDNASSGSGSNTDDRNPGGKPDEPETTVPPSVPETTVPPTTIPDVTTNPGDAAEFQTKHAWSEKTVYLENHVAIYNGNYYRAKWWTQGDSPSAAATNPWDTPWQKITKEVFEKLVSGTPVVQPPNDSPSAPIPPPIVTTPPSSGGGSSSGGVGVGGDKWGANATKDAVEKGYVKEYTWGELPTAIKSKIPATILNGTSFEVKDGTDAAKRFGDLITEAKWNQLFAQANTSAPRVNGEYYYKYNNFIDAMRIIGKYVYIIAKPNNWTENCYVIYKDGNGTTGEAKIRLISGDASATTFTSVTVVDYGAFGTEGTLNDQKRAIAGFLAHASHETSGSWATAPAYPIDISVFKNPDATFTTDMVISGGNLHGFLAWSLWFNEEVAYKGLAGAHYVDSYNATFPPYLGDGTRPASSYHGRGAFQLSWNYNYGLASAIFFGDARVLNKYPEFVVDGVPAAKIIEAGFNNNNWQPNGANDIKGGTMAFLSSLMFWLTPQGAKPSQQDTMIFNTTDGSYKANTTGKVNTTGSAYAKLPADGKRGQPGYGWTINIMNGGFEAGKSWQEGNAKYDAKVRRRVLHYKLFVAAMGGTIHPTEKLDTVDNYSY